MNDQLEVVSNWKHLYGRKWRKARGAFLVDHPLCRMCHEVGKLVRADVVDHVMPHRGDVGLFWNVGNWQALCGHCHNSVKQSHETSTRLAFDVDGEPIGLISEGWKL